MITEKDQALHRAVLALEERLQGSGAGQTFVPTPELALVVNAARESLPRDLRFVLFARRAT